MRRWRRAWRFTHIFWRRAEKPGSLAGRCPLAAENFSHDIAQLRAGLSQGREGNRVNALECRHQARQMRLPAIMEAARRDQPEGAYHQAQGDDGEGELIGVAIERARS